MTTNANPAETLAALIESKAFSLDYDKKQLIISMRDLAAELERAANDMEERDHRPNSRGVCQSTAHSIDVACGAYAAHADELRHLRSILTRIQGC